MNFKVVESDNGTFIAQDRENPVYRFNIHPSDLGRSDPPGDITERVAECLVKRLREKGGKVEPRFLLGECHRNARSLFDHLLNSGYNPTLTIGCNTAAGPAAGLEESYNNIKNIHQWVEVGSYTVEVCSEGNQSMGKMYVSKRTPSNYQPYMRLSESQLNSLSVEYIDSTNIDKVVELIRR